MDTRDIYKLVRELSEERDDVINLYDSMDIELNEGFVIETGVVGFMEDGVIVQLDEDAMEFLDFNGVLLESEDLNETHYIEDSPVYDAVLNRITRQHLDLLSKYGPAAVMAAVEEVAYGVGDVDEIGSSDVSIWTREVIKDLEAGHYDRLKETKLEENPALMALGSAAAMGAGSELAGRVADKIGLEESYDDIDTFKTKVADSDDAFEMIYGAISGDYGEEVRNAIQEMYDDVVIDSQGRLHPDDDFEQIISHVLDQLENDYGITEGGYGRGGYTEVDDFKRRLSSSNDPFEMIYGALGGDYGDEIRDAFQEIYDDVVNDSGYRLHPDDDFEEIINAIVDQYVNDGSDDFNEGAYSDHWDSKYDDDSTDPSVTPRDRERAAGRRRAEDDGWDPKRDEIDEELAFIKKLAHGEKEVDEGLGKALLGGAALIAAITGVNKYQADQMMKNEPQLVALAQMRQEAEQQGDQAKVQQLDDRIQKTMDHIRVTGRPVMGPDGEPIVPGEPLGEAEYQGRKVQLNKPMQGDVKKSKVYVKKPDGKVVKVNFGDKNMRIKKSNPERRKSFRARHNCDNPGPKWKARYWSCRAW